MKRATLIVTSVAAASAIGTWVGGWWMVAVVGAIAGFVLRRDHGRAGLVALGALTGWIVLLAADAAGDRFSTVMTTLAGVMGLPGAAVLLVTLVFAAALGWSSAIIAGSLSS